MGDHNAPAKRNRSRQKRRTRRTILDAAAELMRSGETPTVSRVAEAAEFSRRTVYLYFPTQEQLLAEAALQEVRAEVERALELETDDIWERVDTLVDAVLHSVIESEVVMRTMIRLTLDYRLEEARGGRKRQAPLRGGRRIEWIETALEPVREQLGKERYERLVSALAMCIGIEALLVLRDIRGLNTPEMEHVSRWAARALLQVSLQES